MLCYAKELVNRKSQVERETKPKITTALVGKRKKGVIGTRGHWLRDQHMMRR
jgi:hypothetical protein